MSALPFDPVDPPQDPPQGARTPLMWRLAHRLFREHAAHVELPKVDRPPGRLSCRACGEPWPCGGRRLAERGLRAAFGRG